MTFERDLDGVKVNQHARYLAQWLFRSNVIVQTYMYTHPEQVLNPDNCNRQ